MVINPTPVDLAFTGILFLIVVALSVREKLGLEKTFLHAGLRAVVQLSLVGYLIEYVFGLNRWYLVVAMLVAMTVIAARAGSRRITAKTPWLGGMVWIAVFFSTLLDTFIVTEVVLKIDPWWAPRYLLPLAGMIMGNALNSGSLAGERFISELRNRKAEVETMLVLGFPYQEAVREIKKDSVRGALIPTFNSMFTVGLVHLPGMMTGQILGGSPPVVAAKYQIIVMFMVCSTVVISALILINLLIRRHFTSDHQIRYDLL